MPAMGGNLVKNVSAILVNWGLLRGKFFPFKVDIINPNFQRVLLYRKANRKSLNLLPFAKRTEKLPIVSIPLKHKTLNIHKLKPTQVPGKMQSS